MVRQRDTDGIPRDHSGSTAARPAENTIAVTQDRSAKPVAGKDAHQTRLAVPVSGEGSQSEPSLDPVVGWIVVVDGPGRGRSLALGHGTNEVARSASARVPLDFGDLEVSRSRHAVITFDPRSSRFFIQHGGGTNLTYLRESPVLAPEALQSGDEILMGKTRLRFVALCGPDFSWTARG